ncbi:MAG: hypothetical protein GY874_11670 [Desulfobacteraceae bacterium]|nr:hypothetical protein [Desulfobacteraceae bacterium]
MIQANNLVDPLTFTSPFKNNENGRQQIAKDHPNFRTEIQDRVSLSGEGKKKSDSLKSNEDLSTEEKQRVNELKKRDAEVRAHEQAHMAAGAGVVTGGASYQYEVGPDGKRYAVGGEVKIDVSAERTAEATIRKMQQVKQAALAPAQPSGTDRAVAAKATQAQAQARMEKAAQEAEAMKDDDIENPAVSPIEKEITQASNPVENTDQSEHANGAGGISDNMPKNKPVAPYGPSFGRPNSSKGATINIIL